MDKLKVSRFNIRTNDDEGKLILFNTYSGKFAKFDTAEYKDVISILEDPNSNKNGLTDKLFENGFLIEEKTDEFQKAEKLHNETVFSEQTLELILLPTENCNFRCKYCYESFEKNWMPDSIQEGIIKYIEMNISKYNAVHIEWFGGEPLTAFPVIENISRQVIDICRKNKVRYSASMTTNAYLLTLQMFKKLQRLKIVKYQITIDGAAEFHDKQRVLMGGQSTFQKIINNLIDIKSNVKGKTFSINLRTNITKSMLDSMKEFSEYLVENFMHDDRFNYYWKTVGDWGGDSVKSISLCTDEDIIPLIKTNIKNGLNFSPYTSLINPGGSVCYAAKKNNYVIGSDGIIYKCTVAFNMTENQIGVISSDGHMNIDENKLKLWITGHEDSDTNCQKCFFRPSCQGSVCPLNRIKTQQSPCPPQKKNVKEIIKMIN